MQRLEVSGAVRLIYRSLGFKGFKMAAMTSWTFVWRHLRVPKGCEGAHVAENMCVASTNLHCILRKIHFATEDKNSCIAGTYVSGQVRSEPLCLHTISCILMYWERVTLKSIVILDHFCVLSYRRKRREGSSFVLLQRNKRRIQILKAKDYVIPLFVLRI